MEAVVQRTCETVKLVLKDDEGLVFVVVVLGITATQEYDNKENRYDGAEDGNENGRGHLLSITNAAVSRQPLAFSFIRIAKSKKLRATSCLIEVLDKVDGCGILDLASDQFVAGVT